MRWCEHLVDAQFREEGKCAPIDLALNKILHVLGVRWQLPRSCERVRSFDGGNAFGGPFIEQRFGFRNANFPGALPQREAWLLDQWAVILV